MRTIPFLQVMALLLMPPAAAAVPRSARVVDLKDLSPGERAVIEDARGDKLTHFDPVTAAIATSRSPQDVRDRALSRWRDFLGSIASEAGARPPRARAEWLLRTIHSELLGGGYQFFQNDVASLLETGTFNCVSSSVVYQAAAEHLGLNARGILVPSHVYERVIVDGTDFDIETTSPQGFLMDQDDAGYAKFLARMQLDMSRRYGRKTEAEKFFRREVDDIDLIATLYSNLGAEAVEKGRALDAEAAFARAALLAKDDRYARDSRDVLLGQMADGHILKNELDQARSLYAYAIKDPGADPMLESHFRENIGYCWALEAKAKLDRKDYEGALAAYSAGRKWDDDPALPIDQAATYNKWGLEELEAKEYARAAAVFLRARNDFPKDPIFPQNIKATYFAWSQFQATARQFDEAIATMRELLARVPGDPDAMRGLATVEVQAAQARSTAGDWAGATGLMDDAFAIDPEVPGLRANVAAVWTNAGNAWFGLGDRDHAEAAWKRALAIDPGDKAAKSNLDNLARLKH